MAQELFSTIIVAMWV